jgi:hypothetical protein
LSPPVRWSQRGHIARNGCVLGLFARNGCVLVCLPFVGNVRAIMFNERGTVNDGVMFLSVARTPALEKGGM